MNTIESLACVFPLTPGKAEALRSWGEEILGRAEVITMHSAAVWVSPRIACTFNKRRKGIQRSCTWRGMISSARSRN